MKFYIVPNSSYAMEMDCKDKIEAMETFATKMELDMNTYFKAVTEEEFLDMETERDWDGSKNVFIEFAKETLEDDFGLDPDAAGKVAGVAYEVYCEGNGQTEYEAIEEAYERFEKEHKTPKKDTAPRKKGHKATTR